MTQFKNLRKDIISHISENLPKVEILKPSQTRKQLCRMSCTLARQLMKCDSSLSLSDAMSEAWKLLKTSANRFRFIEFIKIDKKSKKETICRRVIMREKWETYYTPKGTGRPLKEGQFLFVDAAAYIYGLHATRSTYQDRVTEVF